MKSPITGDEMTIVRQTRTLQYRGIDVNILHNSYYCTTSNTYWVTTELDEINMMQFHSIYCKVMGIMSIQNENIKMNWNI